MRLKMSMQAGLVGVCGWREKERLNQHARVAQGIPSAKRFVPAEKQRKELEGGNLVSFREK